MGRRKIGTAIICCSYFFYGIYTLSKKQVLIIVHYNFRAFISLLKVIEDFGNIGEFYFVENIGEVSHDCGLINGTENDFLVMGR